MRKIYIGIETPLFSASNLFSFTLYLSENKYVVIFILRLLDIRLGQMWWHICLNFSFFCLLTNVISDLSNICPLAKYSQIHDFIQWSGNRMAKLFCSTLCGSPAFNRLLHCIRKLHIISEEGHSPPRSALA